MLEITITHNLNDTKEVAELFQRQWIGLSWDRLGSNPEDYSIPRAKQDVRLFNEMQIKGAAVIASYRKAAPSGKRLVGKVEPGIRFENYNGMLCLPLSNVQMIDSSKGFFGNLPPRQCTVQPCGERARGRLAAYVLGEQQELSIDLLHHLDIEWLVTNYLLLEKICECMWSGGRSYEDIDHQGYTKDGKELFAQTTISHSKDTVRNKIDILKKHASNSRILYFFGPKDAAPTTLEDVIYVAIEDVFSAINQTQAGKWLISRMLPF